MAIALAVFGIVLAIVLGAYWVAIVRPETEDRQAIRKRMKQPRSIRLLAKLEKDPTKLSSVGPIDALLGRWDRVSAPLQRMQ